MNDSLLNFAEKQRDLDTLSTTLKKMYENDVAFNTEKALGILTDRTYIVMEYLGGIQLELMDDPGIIKTAEMFDVPKEHVIRDVSEVILMSTIARQELIIEQLSDENG